MCVPREMGEAVLCVIRGGGWVVFIVKWKVCVLRGV